MITVLASLGGFLATLGNLLLNAIAIYRVILIVYFLLSWLPGAYQSTIGQLLIRFCEPYVGFFRQFIPPIGFISLAGLAAYFALNLIEFGVIEVFNFLIRLLA
ncbi:MAG TPA: YggT family protein [Atopostipes sp.]|nr:YggT family protein [Atopostipes sp.]